MGSIDSRLIVTFWIADISEQIKYEDRFVWIGLYEPDEKLLREIQEEFGLHDLAIEDALTAHQRPKLEQYENCLFVVLRTAHLAGEPQHLEFGETHIFVGPRYVVSVRHGSLRSHVGLRARCEASQRWIRFASCLPTALDANLSIISVSQNKDAKRLAAWAAIIAVSTAIAGIYGMNFEFMPELGWRFGYAATVGTMAVVCSGLRFGSSGRAGCRSYSILR